MNEYTDVARTRSNGWPTYRNEYRIIKLLIDARTKVLLRNRDKLELFVPSFNIMKSIEDALKEEFEARKHGKSITSDLANIAAMLSNKKKNFNFNRRFSRFFNFKNTIRCEFFK